MMAGVSAQRRHVAEIALNTKRPEVFECRPIRKIAHAFFPQKHRAQARMTLRLDWGIACRQLQLRSYRQHELMFQRIIKGVLPKEREVIKPLYAAIVEWRNMAPAAAASYTESRHIGVIPIENFLPREIDG